MTSDRKTVIIGILIGFSFLAGTFYAFHYHMGKNFSIPHVHSLADRLTFVLRYQVVGMILLMLNMQQVGLKRFFSKAINPLAGHDHLVETSMRVLTNTMEQYMLSFVNQLMLATWLSEEKLKIIPLINIYFLVGRLSFWIGYQIDHKYRTFGFVVTAIPNLVMTGFNTYFMLTTSNSFLFEPQVKPFTGSGRM